MLYIISLLLYEKDKLDISVALHNIKHRLYQGYKSLHCLLQTCVLICLYMYGMYFVLWDTTLMCETKGRNCIRQIPIWELFKNTGSMSVHILSSTCDTNHAVKTDLLTQPLYEDYLHHVLVGQVDLVLLYWHTHEPCS